MFVFKKQNWNPSKWGIATCAKNTSWATTIQFRKKDNTESLLQETKFNKQKLTRHKQKQKQKQKQKPNNKVSRSHKINEQTTAVLYTMTQTTATQATAVAQAMVTLLDDESNTKTQLCK